MRRMTLGFGDRSTGPADSLEPMGLPPNADHLLRPVNEDVGVSMGPSKETASGSVGQHLQG